MITAKYLGGTLPLPTGRTCAISDPRNFLTVSAMAGGTVRIPYGKITTLAVDGADTIERRITATRLLTIGIFALAFRKTRKQTLFLVIESDDGAGVFELEAKDPAKVRAQVIRWRASHAVR